MLKTTHRWQLVAGFVCMIFLVTACFQSVGDVPQGNAVSERVSETPSPTDTDTPVPTEIPTSEETEVVAVDQPISEQSTATPTDTSTATATATPEATKVAQSGTGEGDNQPDPFQLSATVLIRNATETAAAPLTQTAEALGFNITPTELPTLVPTLDTSGGQIVATQAPVLNGADCVHEVRAGETMYRLSVNYGVLVNTIAAANGIVNPNLILVGQRITIPGCGTTGFVPPPTSTPFASASGAGSVPLPSDNQPQPTGVCGSQYLIQQNDTLFQISLRCGVLVQSIANANGISNINYIRMGDTLTIPPQ